MIFYIKIEFVLDCFMVYYNLIHNTNMGIYWYAIAFKGFIINDDQYNKLIDKYKTNLYKFTCLLSTGDTYIYVFSYEDKIKNIEYNRQIITRQMMYDGFIRPNDINIDLSDYILNDDEIKIYENIKKELNLADIELKIYICQMKNIIHKEKTSYLDSILPLKC
jgi:hypothetical protein